MLLRLVSFLTLVVAVVVAVPCSDPFNACLCMAPVAISSDGVYSVPASCSAGYGSFNLTYVPSSVTICGKEASSCGQSDGVSTGVYDCSAGCNAVGNSNTKNTDSRCTKLGYLCSFTPSAIPTSWLGAFLSSTGFKVIAGSVDINAISSGIAGSNITLSGKTVLASDKCKFSNGSTVVYTNIQSSKCPVPSDFTVGTVLSLVIVDSTNAGKWLPTSNITISVRKPPPKPLSVTATVLNGKVVVAVTISDHENLAKSVEIQATPSTIKLTTVKIPSGPSFVGSLKRASASLAGLVGSGKLRVWARTVGDGGKSEWVFTTITV